MIFNLGQKKVTKKWGIYCHGFATGSFGLIGLDTFFGIGVFFGFSKTMPKVPQYGH